MNPLLADADNNVAKARHRLEDAYFMLDPTGTRVPALEREWKAAVAARKIIADASKGAA